MDTFTAVKIAVVIPESRLAALRAELGAIGTGVACTAERNCQRTRVNAALAIIRRIAPAEESPMRQVLRCTPR